MLPARCRGGKDTVLFHRKSESEDAAGISTPRIVAIISRNQIVELWHIHRQRIDYRERDTETPNAVRTRTVSGRRRSIESYRHQIARQEWGHFVIRRYQATRMLPWTPAFSLAMLIPGTLLAAGSANQGILETPVSLLILQSILISVGGFLALASGWRLIANRLRVTGTLSLESLGASARALGFPSGVVASEPVPAGYRPGRFKGTLEVDLPLGEWEVVEDRTIEVGWRAPTH